LLAYNVLHDIAVKTFLYSPQTGQIAGQILTFGVMSGNLSFIFDSLIIYARKLNISTKRTTDFGVYSVFKSRLITDWSIENMNPDMNPNGMLLDANVSPE